MLYSDGLITMIEPAYSFVVDVAIGWSLLAVDEVTLDLEQKVEYRRTNQRPPSIDLIDIVEVCICDQFDCCKQMQRASF